MRWCTPRLIPSRCLWCAGCLDLAIHHVRVTGGLSTHVGWCLCHHRRQPAIDMYGTHNLHVQCYNLRIVWIVSVRLVRLGLSQMALPSGHSDLPRRMVSALKGGVPHVMRQPSRVTTTLWSCKHRLHSCNGSMHSLRSTRGCSPCHISSCFKHRLSLGVRFPLRTLLI